MLRLWIPLIAAAALLACDAGKAGKPQPEDPAPANLPGPTEAVKSLLDRADALDGKTDKVISNCPPCNCSMAGSEEHASRYGEYTVRMCSSACKENFDRAPEKSITGIKFPDK